MTRAVLRFVVSACVGYVVARFSPLPIAVGFVLVLGVAAVVLLGISHTSGGVGGDNGR